jgi:hypothetical protein
VQGYKCILLARDNIRESLWLSNENRSPSGKSALLAVLALGAISGVAELLLLAMKVDGLFCNGQIGSQ